MEILIYSGIWDFVAENFIQQLNEAAGKDVTIRINSGGGSVNAGYGMLAKMAEYKGKIALKIDGMAASMAAMFPLYASNTEALDVSTFMIHRADMYVESPEDQVWLDRTNADLRSKMQARINEEKLTELKGVTFDDIFNPATRIDVFLSAAEAKEIGLINKVVKLDPKQLDAYSKQYLQAAASMDIITNPIVPVQKNDNSQKINKTMTVAELKEKHPDTYAQILKAGIDQERDRVGSFLAFIDADKTTVVDGIKKGDSLTATQMAEMSLKSVQASTLAALSVEGEKTKTATAEVVTTEATAEEKEIGDFKTKLHAQMKSQGLKK